MKGQESNFSVQVVTLFLGYGAEYYKMIMNIRYKLIK